MDQKQKWSSARRWLVLTLVFTAACSGAPASRPVMPDPLADVSADELYNSGIEFARTGDLWRAEQYLVASMEKGKPRSEVVPTLVQICISLQRFSAALNYAEPVVRDEPGHWRLQRVVGSLYHGLGRLEEARETFLLVLRAAPDDPTTLYFLGMLYVEDLSDISSGDPLLARYIEVDPEGQHASEVRALLRRIRMGTSIERLDADDVPLPVNSGEVPADIPSPVNPADIPSPENVAQDAAPADVPSPVSVAPDVDPPGSDQPVEQPLEEAQP